MKFTIEPADVLFIVKQLQAADAVAPFKLPPQIKFDACAFETGGVVFLDGGYSLPIGGADLKARLMVTGSGRVLRLRIKELKIMGEDAPVAFALKLLNKFGIALPAGLRVVDAAPDLYFEWSLPVDFIEFKSISTEGGVLTISSDGVLLGKLQRFLTAGTVKKLDASGSMADQVNLAQMEKTHG